MTRKGPVPLSEDLERYLSALGLPQVTFLVCLHKSWTEIAGPILAAKASPARFRNGVLTIAVRNHSWAQELQLCKPALLAKVVAATGPGSPISDLRFVVGNLPAEEETAPGPIDDAPVPSVPDPEALADVSDAETRESLRAISRRLRPRGE